MLFYNDLDLNNQKILWLPSIFQFERKVGFWTTLESVQNLKFCNMSLILARYRFEYLASRASPKKLARHWSLGTSLEMSPKFGKLASTSPYKWSTFKLIHYFFPYPCFIYLPHWEKRPLVSPESVQGFSHQKWPNFLIFLRIRKLTKWTSFSVMIHKL